MSDRPIDDAPKRADDQDAPAPERPAPEQEDRPSQAEGDRDDEGGSG